jgi:ankyrin repeat protein
MHASANGALDVCKILTEAGADVTLRDTTDLAEDSFLRSARKGHQLVSSFLIECGVSANTCTSRGTNGIWSTLSRKFNSAANVAHLHSLGVSVVCIDKGSGSSTLHRAAKFGQTESLDLLVQNGADLFLADGAGMTPLHVAAAAGYHGTAKALADLGSNIHARDKKGRTSLHYAARIMNRYAVEVLVQAGADINAQDDSGWTPLTCSCSWNGSMFEEGFKLGGVDTMVVIGDLLNFGARVNARTVHGLSSLHFVSTLGRPNVVAQLIFAGANVEARSRSGRTPLHLATMAGQVETVRVLVGSGARLDSLDRKGNNVLHLAAARGDERTIRELLLLNASDSIRNLAGRSPLDSAARAGHKGVVALLLQRRVGSSVRALSGSETLIGTGLETALRHGRRDVVQLLLQFRLDKGIGSKTVRDVKIIYPPGQMKAHENDTDGEELIGGENAMISLLSDRAVVSL